MTVDTANTYEFDIATVLRQGFKLALLLPSGVALSAAQQAEGGEALQLVMSELPARVLKLRQIRYDYLTLTADSEWLALPTDVWDVGPTAMYIPAGTANLQQAATEVPVEREYGSTFQRRGGKSATSDTPTRFRLDKEQVPWRLELWPIPNEAGTLRVECFKLSANSTDPNKTPDTDRHWAKTLCYGVGAHLAATNAVDLGRVQYLEGRFETLKKQAEGQSKDHAPQAFRLRHPTGWSNR